MDPSRGTNATSRGSADGAAAARPRADSAASSGDARPVHPARGAPDDAALDVASASATVDVDETAGEPEVCGYKVRHDFGRCVVKTHEADTIADVIGLVVRLHDGAEPRDTEPRCALSDNPTVLLDNATRLTSIPDAFTNGPGGEDECYIQVIAVQKKPVGVRHWSRQELTKLLCAAALCTAYVPLTFEAALKGNPFGPDVGSVVKVIFMTIVSNLGISGGIEAAMNIKAKRGLAAVWIEFAALVRARVKQLNLLKVVLAGLAIALVVVALANLIQNM